jgi:glucose/arabinose dehydrogenase
MDVRGWRLLPVITAAVSAVSLAAVGIEAASTSTDVTAAECRGSTGQQTTLLGNSIRRVRKPLFRLRPVARQLQQPVYVASTPAEPTRIYIIEKRGRVRIVDRGRLLAGAFLDVRASVRAQGEEGLLSLAFHPRYRVNRRVYVAFNDRRGDVNLVEYQTNRSKVMPSTARRLFFVDKLEGVTWHNGGQLQFGPDGKLYFSTGDSAHTPLSAARVTDPNNQAQDLGTSFGKLLRIDVDAASPVVVEMVAYGLRNPWRFSFDAATRSLYVGDVGFHLWEEVNVVPDATTGLYNFGWSACEGDGPFVDLDADRDDRGPRSLLGSGTVLPPLIQYAHPRGGYCTARGTVIGGYVYRGTRIPRLRGRYVFGDFCTGEIWTASVSHTRASGIRLEHTRVGRLSSFGVDARGELYATTLGGAVFRLDPHR